MDIQLSEHFWLSEFECKDGTNFVELELVEKLEQLRKLLNVPIVITSGYRSKEYNDSLIKRGYKASPNSKHIQGRAVDIQKFDGFSDSFIEQLASLVGFKGIGIYDNFYHLDIREKLINTVGRDYDRWG